MREQQVGREPELLLRDAPTALKRERRPLVLRVPDQHRREQRHRQQHRQVRLRAREPAAGGGIGQHETGRSGRQQHDRVLGKQPKSHRDANAPPGPCVTLHQCAVQVEHPSRPGRHQRRIRRHQKAGQEESRQRTGEQHGAERDLALATHRPCQAVHVAERGQPTDDGTNAYTSRRIAEQVRTEPVEPGHHGRVVQKRQRHPLRVDPVIGLVDDGVSQRKERQTQRDEESGQHEQLTHGHKRSDGRGSGRGGCIHDDRRAADRARHDTAAPRAPQACFWISSTR
jgi:hypothetical protein